MEGLHVLAQEGNLELSVQLEAKLTTDGALVLKGIVVDKDLFSAVGNGPPQIKWCVQFLQRVLTKVSEGQGVGVRQLDLCGGLVGLEIVVNVSLEVLEEHATEDGIARF